MNCPECGAATVAGTVPEEVREHAPAGQVAVCTDCLSIRPVDDAESPPALDDVSNALPGDAAGALAVVLAADLLSSLATNRPAIESLLETAEHRGVDPVLALQRLAEDPAVEADADLSRRLDQLDGFRS